MGFLNEQKPKNPNFIFFTNLSNSPPDVAI